MANVYQQAAKRRKAVYLAAMGVLLLASLLVRGTFFRKQIDQQTVQQVKDSPALSLTLDGRAKVHELTELHQGDQELGGAAIQLMLTGSRGLAVCALWNTAIEKQRRQEWSELDIAVNSIAKLQPHTIGPWLFQSWNLTYNVSVEMDRLNDMYFYIARGISIAASGERMNRNNPDLRYTVAFFYQNKFSVSDRVTTLRCLYQLSCIPEEDRDPDKLMTVGEGGAKAVDPAAFEDFCRAHPQLVRRLKEVRVFPGAVEEGGQPLVSEPLGVVNFLRANRRVPSRYEPGTRRLHKDREQQFPIFPDLIAPEPSGQQVTTPELAWTAEFPDHDQDAFLASRAWYSLANCSLPPPNPKPNNEGAYNPDKLKYRIPKRPATIIFRQGPPRAQSYFAERLTREGWFDGEPWAIDELADPDRAWLPRVEPDGRRAVRADAVFGSPASAQQAWQEAARRWQEHSAANGLRLEPSVLQGYIEDAEAYCRRHPGKVVGAPADRLTPEEEADPVLGKQRDGQVVMNAWETNRYMTNFETFELEAAAMRTDAAMRAKKRFYQADKAVRLTSDYSRAAALYDEGFDLWKQVLLARQDCRALRSQDPGGLAGRRCQDFRDLSKPQEDVYELNIRYVKLSKDIRQGELWKAALWLNDLATLSSAAAAGTQVQAACGLAVLASEVDWPKANPDDPPFKDVRVPQLKQLSSVLLPGPLDGLAPDGTPWIDAHTKDRVRERLGLIQRRPRPGQAVGADGKPLPPPSEPKGGPG